MARLFDDASSQYLRVGAAPVTAAPLTMACWFRSNDADLNQALMSLNNSGTTTSYFSIVPLGAVAGDAIRFQVSETTAVWATTSTGYSANTWHHACGIESASNSRAIYIDGGSKGTDASSRTPSGLNETFIGALFDVSLPTSGDIAWPAIWDAALTDAEVASLAAGAHPYLVRPESLVFFAPLFGNDSPELELISGNDLTITGATKSAHPGKVFAPLTAITIPTAAAAAAARRVMVIS